MSDRDWVIKALIGNRPALVTAWNESAEFHAQVTLMAETMLAAVEGLAMVADLKRIAHADEVEQIMKGEYRPCDGCKRMRTMDKGHVLCRGCYRKSFEPTVVRPKGDQP